MKALSEDRVRGTGIPVPETSPFGGSGLYTFPSIDEDPQRSDK